jgi:flagellar protein FlgJ
MDLSNFTRGQLDLAAMDTAQAFRLPGEVAQLRQNAGRTPGNLHKAAQEFESYFISYLMKTMRETVPHGLLDRHGEEVWYSFYDQEIAHLATEAGGIGIAQFIDAYIEKTRS